MTTSDTARRSLSLLHLFAATVDGVALSTIVLHVTAHLGLAPTTTGLVLAGAAATALVVAGPLGGVADRVGLRRSGAAAAALSAVALVGYAVAGSLPGYAASAVCFVVAQAVGGAIRQALAVSGVAVDERLHVRATMHTLLNVGIGAGTLVGAALAAVGGSGTFRAAYLTAAIASVVAAAATAGLRGLGATPVAPRGAVGFGQVLRDRRFVAATALTSVVQLTMPILSVLLPIWVLEHTTAPAWVAGAGLAVNTVLVIATQRAWADRLVDPASVARSARVAAAALLTATILLTVSGRMDSPALAVALIIGGVVALTAGEVSGSGATWAVALRDLPDGAEGSYQSTFSMSASAARIVGPGAALPLVVTQPIVGWVVLGLAMGAAALGISRLAESNSTIHPRERNLT